MLSDGADVAEGVTVADTVTGKVSVAVPKTVLTTTPGMFDKLDLVESGRSRW